MDINTLVSILEYFESKNPASPVGNESWANGYNEATKNATNWIRDLIVKVAVENERKRKQRVVDSDAMVDAIGGTIAKKLPMPSGDETQKGELPEGYRYVEVNEFLKEGDIMNQTGMKIQTQGRDDIRCTAPKMWRRKIEDV